MKNNPTVRWALPDYLGGTEVEGRLPVVWHPRLPGAAHNMTEVCL